MSVQRYINKIYCIYNNNKRMKFYMGKSSARLSLCSYGPNQSSYGSLHELRSSRTRSCRTVLRITLRRIQFSSLINVDTIRIIKSIGILATNKRRRIFFQKLIQNVNLPIVCFIVHSLLFISIKVHFITLYLQTCLITN